MHVFKHYGTVELTDWQLFDMKSLMDKRYRRRVQEVIETPPSEQDWADYRAAKIAHDFLLSSPYFRDGGPDEGSEVEKPQSDRQYIYAESEDEWLDRCRDLLKENP